VTLPRQNSIQVRNDEEAVQHAKGERRHGEEIHRCDGLTMIANISLFIQHLKRSSILLAGLLTSIPSSKFHGS
jgi:hypothetical protein